MDLRWFRGQDEKGLKDRVETFMNEDPARQALIIAKLDEGRAYQADVERLKKGSDAASSICGLAFQAAGERPRICNPHRD